MLNFSWFDFKICMNVANHPKALQLVFFKIVKTHIYGKIFYPMKHFEVGSLNTYLHNIIL